MFHSDLPCDKLMHFYYYYYVIITLLCNGEEHLVMILWLIETKQMWIISAVHEGYVK